MKKLLPVTVAAVACLLSITAPQAGSIHTALYWPAPMRER